MSYKRAWLLVETLNRRYREPLVQTSRGGSAKGGAVLTAAGHEVLERYRRMEQLTVVAIENDLAALRRLLVDIREEK